MMHAAERAFRRKECPTDVVTNVKSDWRTTHPSFVVI
jgi:hypothetical protein